MMNRTSRLNRFALVIALALAIPVLLHAHAKLQRSDPANGATVKASPAHIQLWFDEEVDPKVSRIELTGPSGKIALGQAHPMGAKSLMAPVTGKLADATYMVHWQAVAADDGHVTNGDFSFTLKQAH